MSKLQKIRVLIAPDKFRPKMTAARVCQIIKQALPNNYEADCIPLADGGQGSLQCIQQATKSTRKYVNVHDPLLRPMLTFYLLNKTNRMAYIEMAKASGQSLLKINNQQRNPLKTSTFGTGQLIRSALMEGCNKIILLIGGSATNDGGIGAAAALGYNFYDQHDNFIQPIGGNLKRIHRIQNNMPGLFKNAHIKIATDVDNPLIGPQGATFIFGPQKGANQNQINLLQDGMVHLNKKFIQYFKKDFGAIKGSGAAGGLGAGAVAFFNGQITKGVSTIMDIVNMRDRVRNAEIVITGEGKVDKQTLSGKLVKGVVDMGKQQRKRVVVFCGKSELQSEQLGSNVQIIANQKEGMQDAYCIQNSEQLLQNSATHYFSKL